MRTCRTLDIRLVLVYNHIRLSFPELLYFLWKCEVFLLAIPYRPLQQNGAMAYRGEYVFKSIVDMINGIPNGPKITTSMARELRTRIGSRVAGSGWNGDFNLFPPENMFEWVLAELDNTRVRAGKPDEHAIVGMRELKAAALGPDGKLNPETVARVNAFGSEFDNVYQQNMLPLSPYDPMYANRDAFMENGKDFLYTNMSTMVSGAGITGLTRSATDYTMKSASALKPEEIDTAADISGLSRLRPWLTTDEYKRIVSALPKRDEEDFDNRVSRWLVRDTTTFGTDMQDRMLDRAVEMLKYCRFHGIEASIEPVPGYPGQLTMNLPNKTSLRLFDADDPAYSGIRAYVGGSVVLLESHVDPVVPRHGGRYSMSPMVYEKYIRVGANGAPKTNGYIPAVYATSGECVNFMRYLLGEDVDANGKPGLKVGEAVNPNDMAHPLSSMTSNKQEHASMYFGVATGNCGERMRIHYNMEDRTPNVTSFDADTGMVFVTGAVDTARKNFMDAVNIPVLEDMFEAWQNDPDFTPAFYPDEDVAFVQRQYWDILTGAQETLARPGFDMEGDASDNAFGSVYDAPATQADRLALIRQHLNDTLNVNFGTFAPSPADGLRFNPAYVVRYMDSDKHLFRRTDDLVRAMRVIGLNPDELRGDDFSSMVIKERVVNFDTNGVNGPVVPMAQSGDPFIRDMGEVVRQALASNGVVVKPEDIKIDSAGIVQYMGYRSIVNAKGEVTGYPIVSGEIGHILAPDENGVVFNGKKYHIPGYTATIRPNEFGEESSYEVRTLLTSYKQQMTQAIRSTIRMNLMDVGEYKADAPMSQVLGEPTSLDNVLRHMYDITYDADFYERTAESGMSKELRDTIIATNHARVKYENYLMEGANRVQVYSSVGKDATYKHPDRPFDQDTKPYDSLVDNSVDPIVLTGGRNLAIMESTGDGYYDPAFTGNGGAQGVRYLVQGVQVADDGSIIPARVPYIRNPDGTVTCDFENLPRCDMVDYLRKVGRQPDFDAVDRMNMVGNGLLHSRRETDAVGVAQMSFGGMTLEDGIVISKKFAEKYKVASVGGDGAMRSLIAGDKLECHGNKGVVSFVIDPDMDLDEARALGIEKQVLFMRANPDLDVVMSPYSPVSRFNAGLAREAMANGAGDLNIPDFDNPGAVKGVAEGSIGKIRMTILEQTADVKTHYEEDGSPKRSYGAQAGWALAAADCPNLFDDSFKNNTKSIVEMRELLIMCGMDIDETGRLRVGYHPQEGEVRNLIPIRPVNIGAKPGNTNVQYSASLQGNNPDSFAQLISKQGGFIEIPFQLDFPSLKLGKGQRDDDLRAIFPTGKLGKLEPVPDSERSELSKKMFPNGTFKLPLVSSFMRSGQSFEDGNVVYHEWMNAYLRLYKAVLQYEGDLYKELRNNSQMRNPGANVKKLDLWADLDHMADVSELPAASQAAMRKEFQSCMGQAQAAFDSITSDIVSRRFESKHNVFRTGLMANKQANSATAIWSPDPTLGVDTIGINPDMAKALGLKDGDYALIHRDPVLRSSGMRYMKLKFDERLAGISVNPAGVPSGMDGDFDGDTIGVHRPGSPEACAEAMAKLSVKANLLDKNSVDEKAGIDPVTKKHVRYKLFIAGGQDVAAGIAANPELASKYDELEIWVNDFERKGAAGEISAEALSQMRDDAMERISGFLTECYDKGFGRNMLSYKSLEAHVESVQQFVDDGCKGSSKKVDRYAGFLGAVVTRDEQGNIKSVEDNAKAVFSQEHREENIGILKAKNMQQQYTGFGGKFAIRAIRALYNVDPDTALRLTYLATQGVLQVKHDAQMADKYEIVLSGPARDVWKGYQLEPAKETMTTMAPEHSVYIDEEGKAHTRVREVKSTVATWHVVTKKNSKGIDKPISATKEQFVEQFMAVYGGKDGMELAVNKDLVNELAELICSPGPDNVVRAGNIEKGLNEQFGAPLQRLAYDAKLKDIAAMAVEMQSNPNAPGVFDVPRSCTRNYNYHMADAGVMKANLAVARERQANAGGEVKPFKIIAKDDTIQGGMYRSTRAAVGSKLAAGFSSEGFQTDVERVSNKVAIPVQAPPVQAPPQAPAATAPYGVASGAQAPQMDAATIMALAQSLQALGYQIPQIINLPQTPQPENGPRFSMPPVDVTGGAQYAAPGTVKYAPGQCGAPVQAPAQAPAQAPGFQGQPGYGVPAVPVQGPAAAYPANPLPHTYPPVPDPQGQPVQSKAPPVQAPGFQGQPGQVKAPPVQAPGFHGQPVQPKAPPVQAPGPQSRPVPAPGFQGQPGQVKAPPVQAPGFQGQPGQAKAPPVQAPGPQGRPVPAPGFQGQPVQPKAPPVQAPGPQGQPVPVPGFQGQPVQPKAPPVQAPGPQGQPVPVPGFQGQPGQVKAPPVQAPGFQGQPVQPKAPPVQAPGPQGQPVPAPGFQGQPAQFGYPPVPSFLGAIGSTTWTPPAGAQGANGHVPGRTTDDMGAENLTSGKSDRDHGDD